jgi:hypothetical protein
MRRDRRSDELIRRGKNTQHGLRANLQMSRAHRLTHRRFSGTLNMPV